MNNEKIRRILNLSLGLFIGTALCCLLILIRDIATGVSGFSYLIWNLFLAWVPFVIALIIFLTYEEPPEKRATPVMAILLFLWLMFYPNAPYIFTDFIHLFETLPGFKPNRLESNREVLIWYDLVLNAAFAWTGHYLGLVSLTLIHRSLEKITTRLAAWCAMICMIGLSGYGVFLGRFIRLNSWHVITRPIETLLDIRTYLFSFNSFAFSSVFATFILISYLPVAWFSRGPEDGKPAAS